ncbi:hypothetical protein L227DRAFT_581051 [Lentinus tigrinus ALCF2SS1-6]|uniref:Uncharacterized protein n=1 Tax=Lentinus tigrinus ALCF2SS1-6 TaxID=1328759 RepID=A0A5C2RTC6_9APHY|nr:hypothetical protein L227DRAFT_581051 [Lentinus tigrinus ALCF2SS1-6]
MASTWIYGPIHKVFDDEKAQAATFGCLTDKSDARPEHNPTCCCSAHKESPPDAPVLSNIRQVLRDLLGDVIPRYRLIADGVESLVGKHIFLGI